MVQRITLARHHFCPTIHTNLEYDLELIVTTDTIAIGILSYREDICSAFDDETLNVLAD